MTEKKSRLRSGSSSSRRRFLAAAGAGIGVTLAGCTGDSNTQDTSNTDDSSGSSNGQKTGSGSSDTATTIKVAFAQGSGNLVHEGMKRYAIEESGVEIEPTFLPFNNLYTKVSNMLENGSTAYDLIQGDGQMWPTWYSNIDPVRQWLPEDIPDDKFVETTLTGGTWPYPGSPPIPSAEGVDQQLRALPVVGNAQIFAYNKRLYEEVGAETPTTWNDVHQTGKKITNQVQDTFGYTLRGKRGDPVFANFSSIGFSKAGQVFDDEWRYNWDSEAGVTATDFFVNKLNNISPPGSASRSIDQLLNHLASGKAAAAPVWPAATSVLVDPENAEAKNLDFIPVPKWKTQSACQGCWYMGINSHTSKPRKRAAGKLLRAFVSKEGQDAYASKEVGGVPFRHDTFKDNMDNQVWYEPLYGSLQNAVSRPKIPMWFEVMSGIGTNLNKGLSGDVSAQEIQKQSASASEKILEQNGYYE